MKIKAVVFDLDNTIYDYEVCNKAAELALFDHLKELFSLERDVATDLLILAKKQVKARLENTASSHNRMLYMQAICEMLGKAPGEYALDLYNTYWNVFLDNIQIYPEIRLLLQELKSRGLTLVLLTDLTAHIQFRKIQKLGVGECFDYVITSEEAGIEKPDQKMFSLVQIKTGVQRDEILMIGDDPIKDFRGALDYGYHAILFKNDGKIIERVREYEIIDSNTVFQ